MSSSRRRGGDGYVYSSDEGRLCPACERPSAACVCAAERRRRRVQGSAVRSRAGAAGPVRVGRQTKGRKGSGVTVITGLPLSAVELAELGAALKRRCGSGGTVKNGAIEIQGDHRDLLVAELTTRGWPAKRAGG